MSAFTELPSLKFDTALDDDLPGYPTPSGSLLTPLAFSPPPGRHWGSTPTPPSSADYLSVDQLFPVDRPFPATLDLVPTALPPDILPVASLALAAEPSEVSQTTACEQPLAHPAVIEEPEKKPCMVPQDDKAAQQQVPVLFARELDSQTIRETRRVTEEQTDELVKNCRKRSVDIRGTTGRRSCPRDGVVKKTKKAVADGRYSDRLKLNQLYSLVARTRQKAYVINLEDAIVNLEKQVLDEENRLRKLKRENDIMETTTKAAQNVA